MVVQCKLLDLILRIQSKVIRQITKQMMNTNSVAIEFVSMSLHQSYIEQTACQKSPG